MPRGPISKLIGGAVDFTKEYRADQKEQKERKEAREKATAEASAQQQNSQLGVPQHNSTTESGLSASEDDSSDSEDWAVELDEAQQRQRNLNEAQRGDENIDADEILRRFLEQHPPPPYEAVDHQHGPLPMPVILPQRRPESHHRGFVRAYAPVLEDCGIDQATWLEFLDGFEKSIKANPWFNVLNAGVMVAHVAETAVSGFSPISMLVTMAVHTGLEASRRTYIHARQNGYLDKMNEKFFKPRGLFCLVVKYKPSGKEIVEDVDLDSNIAKAVEGRDGQSKWKNAFSSASTTTKNEVEIPEPAPLVFPDLDALDDGKKQNAAKEFGQFVTKYFDRRAASKFEAENPNSKIPQPPHKEQSNVSANSSGGLLSMATGGKVVGPVGRIQQRRNDRREMMGIERRVGRDARKKRKKNRPLKKMMKQDALYLMVVNLPSQEEMDAVAASLEVQ
ncbi:hypothetical protein CkaCkLH20_08274 [Colletotrichum karsti]|uniref:Uncharacterized protein n=1 Tax=Colletotrichum karsti TaxID=1095194 RepID=A0A9P6LIK6_9PEZI|nr:uncharacterized protein CkaCkLH20_08274 [Colletotrichum karsti]KAF9874291.1 hypothetical protein CkaCkLH20_08274 [Colletotrichum karsti]